MAAENELAEKLGIEAVSVAGDKSVFSMPVVGNRQPATLLHGGATAALCENAASAAANAYAQTLGGVAAGTELTISHLKAVRTGVVTATAIAEHLGRTRTVHRVEVVDEDECTIAVALVTNYVLGP